MVAGDELEQFSCVVLRAVSEIGIRNLYYEFKVPTLAEWVSPNRTVGNEDTNTEPGQCDRPRLRAFRTPGAKDQGR